MAGWEALIPTWSKRQRERSGWHQMIPGLNQRMNSAERLPFFFNAAEQVVDEPFTITSPPGGAWQATGGTVTINVPESRWVGFMFRASVQQVANNCITDPAWTWGPSFGVELAWRRDGVAHYFGGPGLGEATTPPSVQQTLTSPNGTVMGYVGGLTTDQPAAGSQTYELVARKHGSDSGVAGYVADCVGSNDPIISQQRALAVVL